MMLILYLKEKNKTITRSQARNPSRPRRFDGLIRWSCRKHILERMGKDGAEVERIKSIKFLKFVESFVWFDLSVQFKNP